MKRIAVIAPHPDDETLGCGGTLLRHAAEGSELHWIVVTGLAHPVAGGTPERVSRREKEIAEVAGKFGFKTVNQLGLAPARLDALPLGDLVGALGKIFEDLQPEVVYAPWRGDVHTDHRVVFDAVNSCSKWFRYPSVKRVLCYETLSETGFSLNPDSPAFRPNVFVDIGAYLGTKIGIMSLYAGESAPHPFPRSIEAIRAQALMRGSEAGCSAAEAFVLLRDIS